MDDPSSRVRSRSWIWTAVALVFLTTLVSIWILYRFRFRLYEWDENVGYLDDLFIPFWSGKSGWWHGFIAPHGGSHRLLPTRIVAFVAMILDGGVMDTRVISILNIPIHAGLVVAALRLFAKTMTRRWIPLLGVLLAFLIVSPINTNYQFSFDNQYWIHWLIAIGFVTLMASDLLDKKKLILAAILLGLEAYNLGSGWVLGLGAIACFPRWRNHAVVATFVLLLYCVVLQHFSKVPGFVTPPPDLLRVFSYFLDCVAWPIPLRWWGLVLVVFWSATYIQFVRGKVLQGPEGRALMMFSVFLLVNIFGICYTRDWAGTSPLTQTRYLELFGLWQISAFCCVYALLGSIRIRVVINSSLLAWAAACVVFTYLHTVDYLETVQYPVRRFQASQDAMLDYMETHDPKYLVNVRQLSKPNTIAKNLDNPIVREHLPLSPDERERIGLQ